MSSSPSRPPDTSEGHCPYVHLLPLISPVKPPSNLDKPKSKSYECPYCLKHFARFEHLRRHERIHTNEKPFSCTRCPKSFTRKDLLVRHGRAMHNVNISSASISQSRPSPQRESSPELPALQPSEGHQPKKPRLDQESYPRMGSRLDASVLGQRSSYFTSAPRESHPTFGGYQVEPESTQPSTISSHGLSSNSFRSSGMQSVQRTGNIFGIPQEGLFNTLWDSQLFESPWMGNFDLSTAAFPSIVHAAQPLWPTSNDRPSPPSTDREPQRYHERTDSESTEDAITGLSPAPRSSAPKGDDARGRPSAASLFYRIFSRQASLDGSEKHHLNRLKPSQNQPVFAPVVRDRLEVHLKSLVHLLPRDFVLPSQYSLGRYVSAYFDGFYPHLPFLHVPSWSPMSCHVGLLFAMCALGAKYSLEKDISMALWKAGRLVVRMATEESGMDLDGDRSVDIEICQAMLLLMACQTWTGDKFLLRQALSFQSTLASLVRQYEPQNASRSDQMTWKEWIEYEGCKRTKFAVYCFFNLQYIAYNIPPLILSREIELDLPSDEEAWGAESENQWRQYGRGQASKTPSFGITLRRLLSEAESTSREGSLSLPEIRPQDSVSYSLFGSYVVLHGLIQHHYQLRQYASLGVLRPDGGSGGVGSPLPLDLSSVEHGLRRWQELWEKFPETSLNPRVPDGPLAFNCTALLRIAHLRLVQQVDFGPVCSSIQSGDPITVAKAIKDQCRIAKKGTPSYSSPELTRAALHSCHALLILAKEGLELAAHTQAFIGSIAHFMASFQCCLVLAKWLEAVVIPAPASGSVKNDHTHNHDAKNEPNKAARTTRLGVNNKAHEAKDERQEEKKFLVTLLQETLQECNVRGVEDARTLEEGVLRAWSRVFIGIGGSTCIWGIMGLIGNAIERYAEMVSAPKSGSSGHE